MDDKERKRIEKQKKAARERERYKYAREVLGLSRQEARNISKTLANRPEIITDIENLSPTLAKGIENLGEMISAYATDGVGEAKPKRSRKKKPTVKFREKQKKTASEIKRNREAGYFKAHVKRQLKKNPNIKQRDIIKDWRARGHTISNDRAADIFREATGRKLDVRKRTRVKTYASDKTPEGIFFQKERFMHKVGYQVVVSGEHDDDVEDRFMYIASPYKLSREEIELDVERAFNDGEADKNEYYTAVYLVPNSAKLIYIVDTTKRTKAFDKYYNRMKESNPELTPSAIFRMWKEKKK